MSIAYQIKMLRKVLAAVSIVIQQNVSFSLIQRDFAAFASSRIEERCGSCETANRCLRIPFAGPVVAGSGSCPYVPIADLGKT